jgi:dGTPase
MVTDDFSSGTPDSPPWSVRAHEARRRAADPRTSFEVDRDRIIHSGTFRELQYKTQVQSLLAQQPSRIFRTRLNHVLEVAQIARGLARLTSGEESLAEAIALAHDLGHPPFGHAGERGLRDALRRHGREGWNANVHSLEVVDSVEVAFMTFRGLDLTFAVREGIARHSTPFDEPVSFGEFVATPNGGLECQIVDVADVFAYVSHDLDDAVAGGYVTWDDLHGLALIDDLLEDARNVWGRPQSRAWPDDERETLIRRRVVATLVYRLLQDTATNSNRLLRERSIDSASEVRASVDRVVVPPGELATLIQKLLAVLTQRYYRSEAVAGADVEAKHLMNELLDALVAEPREVPNRFRDAADDLIAAATYLASLNDFAAFELARRLGITSSELPKSS